MKKLFVLLVSIAITACGGGGGGGGGGGTGGDSGGSTPRLSASPPSLDFTSTQGLNNPPEQKIYAKVSNSNKLSGNIYVNLLLPDDRFFNADINILGDQATITVGVTSADSIGPGSYTSSLQIQVCTDQACKNQIAGSPVTAQINYKVNKPNIKASVDNISFSGKRGQQPDPITFNYFATSMPINLNGNDVYNNVKVDIEYTSTETDWLTAVQDKNNLKYQLGVSRPVPVGVHTAKLNFSSTDGILNSYSIPVTYTVSENSIVTNLDAFVFELLQQSNESTFSKSIELTAATDSFGWTASANQPWLTVTESGNTNNGSSLQVTLNSEVAKLKNGIYQALVSVQRDGSNDRYDVPVTLDMNTIQLDYATPWYSYTGSTQDLHIFGENLDQLDTIYFNDQAVTNFTLVNDGEIQVTLPALASATYTINTGADVDAVASKAQVSILEPENFPAADISLPRAGLNVLYEPVTQQLILDNGDFGPDASVLIYRFIDGQWQQRTIDSPNALPIYGYSYSITPDGRELILAGPNRSIWAIDLETLKARKLTEYSYVSKLESIGSVISLSDDELLFHDNYFGSLLVVYNRRTNQNRYIDVTKLEPENFWRHMHHISASTTRNYVEISMMDMNNNGSIGIFNPSDYSIKLEDKSESNGISSDGKKLAYWDGKVYDDQNNLLGRLADDSFRNIWFTTDNDYAFGLKYSGGLYKYDLQSSTDGYFSGTELSNEYLIDTISPSGKTAFNVNESTLEIIPLE